MPQLIATVNIPLVDVDGTNHRARKEIDLLSDLTSAQQTAISSIFDRITNTIETKYGNETILESIIYKP